MSLAAVPTLSPSTQCRPIEDYFAALEEAKLAVVALAEPTPDDDCIARVPTMEAFRDRPSFLYVRAEKRRRRRDP